MAQAALRGRLERYFLLAIYEAGGVLHGTLSLSIAGIHVHLRNSESVLATYFCSER